VSRPEIGRPAKGLETGRSMAGEQDDQHGPLDRCATAHDKTPRGTV
jgi:hypothetical protein